MLFDAIDRQALSYYLDKRNRARRDEERRVIDVIVRGAEDDEPAPDEDLLGLGFFSPNAEVSQ
jgi:hypothetical protein